MRNSMEETFRFVDDLGPAKIIHVSQPSLGLRATLVVDNVARGPSIGGLRMAPDVALAQSGLIDRGLVALVDRRAASLNG